jgi:hypothetical protein
MKIPSRTKPADSMSCAERFAELDAKIKLGIVQMEDDLSQLSKLFLTDPDPLLDAPMDAKTFFNFITTEPQEFRDEICDTIFKAVIGFRFSKGGSITRRELNVLRECGEAWRKVAAREKAVAT